MDGLGEFQPVWRQQWNFSDTLGLVIALPW